MTKGAASETSSHSLTVSLGFLCFPQQNFDMGSLAQIKSSAIRCSFNTRFRKSFRWVLVQIPREVAEGSGADIFCKVLEGSGEDTC